MTWPARALGLLISEPGPKGHDTHNAPIFSLLEDRAPLVEEKYYVSRPLVWRIGDS